MQIDQDYRSKPDDDQVTLCQKNLNYFEKKYLKAYQ